MGFGEPELRRHADDHRLHQYLAEILQISTGEYTHLILYLERTEMLF